MSYLSALRAGLVLLAFVLLSGCAAVPIITTAGTVAGGVMLEEGVLKKHVADAIGEERLEELLEIGKKRHPAVFASLTIEDRAFTCLFMRQEVRYNRELQSLGERRATVRAVDRAAVEYADGVCGDFDLKRRVFGPNT